MANLCEATTVMVRFDETILPEVQYWPCPCFREEFSMEIPLLLWDMAHDYLTVPLLERPNVTSKQTFVPSSLSLMPAGAWFLEIWSELGVKVPTFR